MTFKTFAAAALAATSILTLAPAANAGTLSANEAMQLCMAAKEANDMGLQRAELISE